jgi:farnesyl-diphosphate farnesyltransferase
MTLSKIAKQKEFAHQNEVKLSRKTVMAFYSFSNIAANSDLMMKAFFKLSTSALRNLK